MIRPATPGELDRMTEAVRGRYDQGTPFSYAQIGQSYRLRLLAGPPMDGAYIVQRSHAALTRILIEIKDHSL